MSLNMFSVIIHEAYLEVRFGLVRVYMLSLFVFWDFFQTPIKIKVLCFINIICCYLFLEMIYLNNLKKLWYSTNILDTFLNLIRRNGSPRWNKIILITILQMDNLTQSSGLLYLRL